jgi:hypothetical protein
MTYLVLGIKKNGEIKVKHEWDIGQLHNAKAHAFAILIDHIKQHTTGDGDFIDTYKELLERVPKMRQYVYECLEKHSSYTMLDGFEIRIQEKENKPGKKFNKILSSWVEPKKPEEPKLEEPKLEEPKEINWVAVELRKQNLGRIFGCETRDESIEMAMALLEKHLIGKINSEKHLEMLNKQRDHIKDCIDTSGWYLLPDDFEVAVRKVE